MENSDIECLGGSIKFVYKPGAHHKVPDYLSRNPTLLDQVPQELTNLEQENWISAQVLLDKENEPKQIGITGSFVEPQENC